MTLRRPLLWLVTALVAVAVTVPSTLLGGLPAQADDSGSGTSAGTSAGGGTDARTVRIGGVRVRLTARTTQVVTVKQRSGWHSRVSLWQRRDGDWRRTRTAYDGRTGYGGLVPGKDREQGGGTTPLGSYRVTETFGLARRPRGADLAFHRVRAGDYWVQDNGSRWYNTLRNKDQGGFRWWRSGYNSSERLRDYDQQYRWSIVIDFNRPDPVRHRGSGIFLHVNGSGATAGCVSAPRAFVRAAMKTLDPARRPVIAIGR